MTTSNCHKQLSSLKSLSHYALPEFSLWESGTPNFSGWPKKTISCEGYCPLQWHKRNSGHEGTTSHNDNFMLQTPTDFTSITCSLCSLPEPSFWETEDAQILWKPPKKMHLIWRICVLYNEISAVLAVKVPPCTIKTSYCKRRSTSLKSPAHCALFQTPVSAK